MFGTLAKDAILDVVGEQKEPKLIERGAKSGHLSEDINTVALLVNHLLDSADLTGDSGKALFSVGVDVVTHSTIITINLS